MIKPFSAVILAAGKGTRMKSASAKVLHEVFFAPMLHHVLDATLALSPKTTFVITGHQSEKVASSLRGYPETQTVFQKEQRGTGHAVLCAREHFRNSSESILILCGDTPLVQPSTLQNVLDTHIEANAHLTLLTTQLANPTNYGRILRSPSGTVNGIREEKDCSDEEKLIREINAGIYCVESSFLFSALELVTDDNSQGELYLTDIVRIGVESQKNVVTCNVEDPREVLGVNSRVELSQAHQLLQMRYNEKLMLSGITMYHPQTISVDPAATIGIDTILEQGVQILGDTEIAQNCRIGQGSIVENCSIGKGAIIGPYSFLREETVGPEQIIPPYSRT